MREVKQIGKKNQKSGRNKTIDFTLDEGKEYFDKVIKIKESVLIQDVENKSIQGDTMEVLDLLPEKSIDLIIVDPPYNLTKNYHGKQFDKIKENDYYLFTKKWVEKAKRILTDEGTIYVCCDWQSSLIIERVLREYFIIQNRITWQREKGRGAKTNWKNSMEDIWFATNSRNYTFNVEDVKVRKKVIAPYRVDGKPKDWDESENGNFRNSYPSNIWTDITIPFWSMPENTAHPTQ